MNVLIPLAGPDDAFRDRGFRYCKSLIEIDGRPLLQGVLENLTVLAPEGLILIVRKDEDEQFHLGDVVRLLDPRSIVLRVESLTGGAACTALLAVEHIDNDEELIITNGDQLLLCDLRAAVADFRRRELDAATIVFDSVHPRWSYVRVGDDGLIVEAAEKRPLSRWATAGFYYFRRGRDFVSAAINMLRKDAHVGGGFYVCPTFNEMILRHSRIGTFPIQKSAYVSFALPEDVEAYLERAVARHRDAAGTS